MQQYIGGFYKSIFTLLMKDDGYTIGQKLTQLEKASKKRFFDLSDKEIYEVLGEVIAENTADTELTDEEFNNWIEDKKWKK